jgi:predicted Fe-Mo cluster-binding NifX family protein
VLNVKSMKVAIPTHLGRVSPVFDVAGRLLIVDVKDGREVGRSEVGLTAAETIARATELAAADVAMLICGALSLEQYAALTSCGVTVIPQVCGPVDEVLAAYLDGSLGDGRLRMPGCCGRRRRLGGRGGRGRRWAIESGT